MDAISVCERAPELAELAAITRDVHEFGFAVIPDFIDEGEVDDLRQACGLLAARLQIS